MIQANAPTTCHRIDCGDLPVQVTISRFRGDSGTSEYHLMVQPTEYASFGEQLEWLCRAYRMALDSAGLDAGTCVLRRVFCSDLVNQSEALDADPITKRDDAGEPCAVSRVCQPPALPAKIALWAYHVTDPGGPLVKSKVGGSLCLKRGELEHVWATDLTCLDAESSYSQTKGILNEYDGLLQSRHLRLADNVIRTWFFVRDVDANYKGLVAARKEIFAGCGMTPDTHFIASTGIEGSSSDVAATVMMDAYAISGVRREQIEFLSAPEHLSPTHVYGVTFERGVSVAYRDRKHVCISGTASIDHTGAIVHPGNVLRQLDRTLENVEALLHNAGATLRDSCMFIVYVRDASDLAVARIAVQERLGEIPVQIVVAPVCRPGWLIEVECQAIVAASSPALPAF